jgi:hypothetical protein
MPFKHVKKTEPQKDFEEIDKIICSEVIPNLIPYTIDYLPSTEDPKFKIYVLLPNAKPSLFPQEKGPMKNQDHNKYFGLKSLDAGLSYSELGLWLDICLDKYTTEHVDGITRYIYADKESICRFDERKPIYYHQGIARNYLSVRI